MAKRRNKESNKTYWCFAVLRFVLTLLPQTGYIHPDEFFQNVEILAGKTFNYEASIPWEFNVTAPIRSIGMSYFTVGFSYQILKLIDIFLRRLFKLSIITPYAILVTPRILMCLLSYVVDYTVYMICNKNNEKSKSRLITLSTSYVLMVYCTRTFTNTLEVILFAMLLYFVADSMIFTNILVRQREYLNDRYERSENPAQRAKFHKLRLFLASDKYVNCIAIATITSLGFFNRPTFLAYALFPVFFWLYRGIGYRSVSKLQFNTRILALVIAATPTIILLIIIDSFFYGYITWGEIGMLDISINSFVFTPLNFIKYNIDSNNLAKHGLHPRYLHVLVNIPLLFNILGIFGILGTLDLSIKLLQRKFTVLPTVRSIKGLMTMSFIAPTFFLSIFPHQEPRFLLPIIIPLIYLYAHKICQEPERDIVLSQKETSIKSTSDGESTAKQSVNESNTLLRIWIGINILLTIFYGFIHQGGLIPATAHLSDEMLQKHHYSYNIITSHTYSIPHVLFMQPDVDVINTKQTKFKLSKRVFTHEEGSSRFSFLAEKMRTILLIANKSKKRHKMFLLVTGTKHYELIDAMSVGHLSIRHIASFYPHFSTEALPDFSELIHIISVASVKTLNFQAIIECFRNIFSSLDLKIYEVQLRTPL